MQSAPLPFDLMTASFPGPPLSCPPDLVRLLVLLGLLQPPPELHDLFACVCALLPRLRLLQLCLDRRELEAEEGGGGGHTVGDDLARPYHITGTMARNITNSITAVFEMLPKA